MDPKKLEHLKTYLKHVRHAQKEYTKKEHFKDLLNRLYQDSPEILHILDKMSSGAEKAIFNIPREDRLHHGSADTLYNQVIIEFENNLNISLEHAKEQLAGYLLGEFNTGEGYNYTLIASDCISWRVFSIEVSSIEKLDGILEGDLELIEIENAAIDLNEKNIEDFYYWIDRFLFKKEKQRATLGRIEEAFGYQSHVFIESLRQLTNHFQEIKKFGEVQVSFEQWGKFLSIAYGSFEASERNFLIHTYLSVFSKMLAYSVVSNDQFIEENELKGIIDGSIFDRYNIKNFVDNDFYHWVKNERSFKALKKVFRLISQEISNFDFNKVDEDVLKGVYQELIDLDTRHALGEYYTPDWLCERILQEFDLKKGDRVLDPACGSGSFLRAMFHRFKELNPEMTVNELNDSIYGIDIHPLSVQIAKTTMLLAMGREVIESRLPIQINVILANTLRSPDGVETIFGKKFKMEIDRDTLELSSKILDDVKTFDKALDTCEELAEQTLIEKDISIEVFGNILENRLNNEGLNSQVVESFHKIYSSLKKAKKQGRDSIWKFIVENLYKPYFLMGKFDYVIGNPPWFTYSTIKNEKYQDLLSELAIKYDVKPSKVADFPHLEIATIFLAYCSNYFIKNNGKLAFVLPRSFFSASHHDKVRKGKATGFILTDCWDMHDVAPLFNVPSCVLFSKRTDKNPDYEKKGLSGILFEGKLPAHNCNLEIARKQLTEFKDKFYLRKQGKSSAFSTSTEKIIDRVNPYAKDFKQGATIVPRAFYFVELNQEAPPDFHDRIVSLKTQEAIKAYLKPPWDKFSVKDKIESRFLFRTALSKSILPFALFDPELIVLPATVEVNDAGEKSIALHDSKELMTMGYLNASRWMKNTENIWAICRTEKNKNISAEDYVNWQNKLTSQNLDAPYLVIYNASGKDANALVIKRNQLDLDFIADSKSYISFRSDLSEAYYLTAFLNSSIPNKLMKDFQSRGLFGARDVSKKILDVYFPKFDAGNEKHMRLAELSETAHEKANEYLLDNLPERDLSPRRLGNIRLKIKEHLTDELTAIDKIVEELILER